MANQETITVTKTRVSSLTSTGFVLATVMVTTSLLSGLFAIFFMSASLGQSVNAGLNYNSVNTNINALVCGNTVVQSGEDCDDGNTVSCDGCSASCHHETLADTVDCGLNYSYICGNSIVETGEYCDDGNDVSCDGCSATCQHETLADVVNCGLGYGYVCGNGVVETGEECDDGNITNCDRCSSACLLERLIDMVNCGSNYNTKLFLRGDANGDRRVDTADGRAVINHLLCLANADGCAQYPNSLRCRVNQGMCYSAPDCDDARDANDDGVINYNDANFIFNYMLKRGPVPPAPGPLRPGPDPTADQLGCNTP